MAAIRIMPLGDSITRGQTAGVSSSLWEGYRGPLYTLLTAAGYAFDFVGSASAGDTLPDKDHEGHGGDAITVINAAVAGYLSANPPDIIVLIAGTNDINNGDSGSTAAASMATLLATIYSNRPQARVVLAEPPLMTNSAASRWADYVALLPSVVAARVAAGQWVRLVDTSTVLTQDTVGHPTTAGYAELATVLLPAIRLAIADVEEERGDVADLTLIGDIDLAPGTLDRLLGTLHGTLSTIYRPYHVVLGGVGLLLAPGGYERRLQQAFAAKLSTGQLSQADRLTDQAVLLDGWQGGEGVLRHDPENPDRYRFGGGIDVYSEPGAVGLGPRMVLSWSSALNGLTKLCASRTEMFVGTTTGVIYTWSGSGSATSDHTTGKAGGITALCRAFSDVVFAGNGTDGTIYKHLVSGGWSTLGTLSGTVTSCRAIAAHWKDGTQWVYLGADNSGGRAILQYTDGATITSYATAVVDEPQIDLMIRKRGNLVIVGNDHTHRRAGIYLIDDSGAVNTGFDQRLRQEGSVLQCGAVIGDALYLGDKYGGRVWNWDGTDLILVHRFGSDLNPYSTEIRGMWAWDGALWVSIVDEDGTIGLARLDPDTGAWSRPVTGLSGTTPEDLAEFQGKLVAITSATGASKLYNTDGTYTSTGNVESSLIDARLAGTDKLLRGVTVNHSELAATQSVEVQYQLEDDGTWVSLGTSDTDGATTASFDFPSAITADLFALKLILTGTAGSSTPLKVYSVNLRYYPSPGAKREWSLDVLLHGTANRAQRLQDGSSETRTGEEISAEVWALVAAGAPVNLVDLDRSEYTVQIAEYREAPDLTGVDGLDVGYTFKGSLRLVEV